MSQEVRINFTANTAGFLSGVRNIQTAIARTTESIQNKTKEWSIDIANATTALRNGARVIQATASWLSAPLREFSRFEDAATRLAPLVGGLEAAKSLCEELRDEAANGTMSFEQLASVAGRLSTVFKNPADVQKWTTIFHNISAGTELGNHGIRGIHRKFFEINPSPRSHGNEILFQTREVPDCGGNLLKFDASYTSHVPARFSGIQ